jgi:hypothetical protein
MALIVPVGETTLIVSPGKAPRRSASSLPRMMPGFWIVDRWQFDRNRLSQILKISRYQVLRERRHLAFPQRIDAAKHDPLGTVWCGQHHLLQDERRRRNHVGDLLDLLGGRIVLGHAVFHAVLHDDVCGGP